MIIKQNIDIVDALKTGSFKNLDDNELSDVFRQYAAWIVTGILPAHSDIAHIIKQYVSCGSTAEEAEEHLILECARRFVKHADQFRNERDALELDRGYDSGDIPERQHNDEERDWTEHLYEMIDKTKKKARTRKGPDDPHSVSLEGEEKQQQDTAVWNGQRFWCGAYDKAKRKIVEVHTYEECFNVDFNSEWVFDKLMPADQAEKMFNEGEWVFFWVDNGVIHLQDEIDGWFDRQMEKIKENIEQQITYDRKEERDGKE